MAELAPDLDSTLLNMDNWLSFIQAEGFDAALARAAGPGALEGQDAVDRIADYFLKETRPAHRILLRKSVLECLLLIFGLEPELSRSQLTEKCMRFLGTYGPSGVLRHLASLHVFNVIWFRAGESFRALAPTQDAFIHDMVRLEWMCRRIVDAAWERRKLQSPLSPPSLDEFMDEIKGRFLGNVEK